jgi:hypothetical protein
VASRVWARVVLAGPRASLAIEVRAFFAKKFQACVAERLTGILPGRQVSCFWGA